MRTIVIFWILIFIPRLLFSNNFEHFLENTALELAAYSAHPGTLFSKEKSQTIVLDDQVIFIIGYENYPYQTVLDLKLDNGIPVEISTYFDSHWFPAFANIENLLSLFNLFDTKVETNSIVEESVKRYYENKFGKRLLEWTGEELAVASISVYWAKYLEEDVPPYPSSPYSSGQFNTNKDGIIIIGNDEFASNVRKALDLIQKYWPDFYETQIVGTNSSKGVLKAISSSPKNGKYSTIGEGWVVNLAESHTARYNRDNYSYDVLGLATTIIHETVHLHQYARHYALLKCNLNGYLLSYDYSPVLRAKYEQEAYKYGASFLGVLLKQYPDNKKIEQMQNFHLDRYENYENLKSAGKQMFLSRHPEADCKVKCMQAACQYYNEFAAGYGKNNLAYLKAYKEKLCK